MRKKIEILMREYDFDYAGNYANYQLQTILLLYCKTVNTIMLVEGLCQIIETKTYAVRFVTDKHSNKLFDIKFNVCNEKNKIVFEKSIYSLKQLKVMLEDTKQRQSIL